MTSAGAPPLRFLGLVLGGWVCARAIFLGLEWLEQPPSVSAAVAIPAASHPAPNQSPNSAADAMLPSDPRPATAGRPSFVAVFASPVRLQRAVAAAVAPPTSYAVHAPPPAAHVQADGVPGLSPLPVAQAPAVASRWAGSAWLFLREGRQQQLAPGGTLGGSQIGARLGYRLNEEGARPLALSARFYSPVRDLDEAEAAVGIEWQPSRAVPVRLLAERRQALGESGRSAFALTAYGGVSDQPVGPLRLESYAQAGVVGLRSRDLFADGSARLLAPVAAVPGLAAGAGLWGAAQPGVSRLDAGPAISLRILPNIRAVAEWRLRVAGDAEPGSGPALTLAADF